MLSPNSKYRDMGTAMTGSYTACHILSSSIPNRVPTTNTWEFHRTLTLNHTRIFGLV
jgi:hypothetical protein